MRSVRAIFFSVLSALLAAVFGWCAGDLIGPRFETGTGLGTGLPIVWLMYVLSLALGFVGVCNVLGLAAEIAASKRSDAVAGVTPHIAQDALWANEKRKVARTP